MLVLTLAAVACTDGGSTTGTTTAAEPGRLVTLDSEGDVVVLDPDGSNSRKITDAAGQDVIHTQPIWSPDGSTIAWGQADENGFSVGVGSPSSEVTTSITMPNLPFYMYWSPDSRSLGVLHNGTTGVEFQVVDVAEETSSSLDEDSPFYFSWSPESDRVVTHAGPTRTETITPDGDRVELEPTAGSYLAPQWTPNGVFHVAGDRLLLEDEEGERRPIVGTAGFTMFIANPQGTHVAYQSTDDSSGITASTEELPTPITNSVVVADVETGETEIVDTELALGFFWSPDSRSLLVLTTSESTVVPLIWTVDGNQTDYPGYEPSPRMLQDTFPFFPQYAQSVSFWAPGSEAFAYAGQMDDERGVWVQALDGATPTRVSDGRWVAWSPPEP